MPESSTDPQDIRRVASERMIEDWEVWQANLSRRLSASLLTGSETDYVGRSLVDHPYLPWVRNWHVMPDGYRRAAQLLAEHLQHDDFDYLFGPVVFLYRHAIELELKSLRRVALAHLADGSEGRKSGHALSELWDEVDGLLKRCEVPAAWYGGGIPPEVIGDRIRELQRIDARNDAFRYPDGATDLGEGHELGVDALSHTLDAVFDWLEGIATGLAERRSD